MNKFDVDRIFTTYLDYLDELQEGIGDFYLDNPACIPDFALQFMRVKNPSIMRLSANWKGSKNHMTHHISRNTIHGSKVSCYNLKPHVSKVICWQEWHWGHTMMQCFTIHRYKECPYLPYGSEDLSSANYE